MSTSRFLDTRYVKWLVIVNAFVPLALLIYDAYAHQLGVNEVNFAIKTTGLVGLTLLVLALVITPLRRLTGWNMLISIRRNLGVIGFTYIAVHFTIFDKLFGTHFLPEDRWPAGYGIEGHPVPKGYMKQLKYPFGPLQT